MYLADMLSRAPCAQASQSPAEEEAYEVMSVSYISTPCLEELRRHTAEDEELQTLSAVFSGVDGPPEKAISNPPSFPSFPTGTNSGWWRYHEKPQSSHPLLPVQRVYHHHTQRPPRC